VKNRILPLPFLWILFFLNNLWASPGDLLLSPRTDPDRLFRSICTFDEAHRLPGFEEPHGLALDREAYRLALDAIAPGGTPRWSWYSGAQESRDYQANRLLLLICAARSPTSCGEQELVRKALAAPAAKSEPGRGQFKLCHAIGSLEQLEKAAAELESGAVSCQILTLSFLDRSSTPEQRLVLVQRLVGRCAGTVLFNRWQVAAPPHRAFLARFYRDLAGVGGPAEAVFVARRGLLHQEGGRYRHPHYWATWVLIGDGQTSVELPRRPLPLRLTVPLALLIGMLLATLGRGLVQP
jgi:hypothetical protein